jgi:aminoglycoside phosphotransferase (APT) family kinase protein
MARPGDVALVPVQPRHRFDEARLLDYLQEHVPGFGRACVIRQFLGGQSNPTFHLETPDRVYVLRKKPPGALLPSAHAVDREYAIMKALAGTAVPVPRMIVLCSDESIIGQIFYVMEYVPGLIFNDRLMGGCSVDERRRAYDGMNDGLAALHGVDFRSIGLEWLGRSENYAERQVARWSRQYLAAKSVDLPQMALLMEWFENHPPVADQAALVHGDYRMGNLVFEPNETRLAAVLDWELGTIGHPLSDLAYCCLSYRLPEWTERGFSDIDIAALGIPSETEFLAAYCQRTGRDTIPDWNYFMVLSLFRLAAILVGIHRRALDGTAADTARAAAVADIYPLVAELAWEAAQND